MEALHVDEDDEDVESLSSAAAPSDQRVVSSGDKLSFSSPTPGRCISKEMLEQTPHLGINTRYHEVTIPKPFGCFHLMQLVEKSIQVGALFSPKLFVPKEIWQQDHVKLAGVPLKIEVLQQLKQGLEKTSHTFPLSSDTAKAAFVQELDAFLEDARQERTQLIRSFPFLSQDTRTQMRGRSTSGNDDGSAETHSNLGKLTNLAYGFGRMVKKQAIAAVERVGAAPATSVTMAELDEYAAVLCLFCNSTRNIETLLGLRAEADGSQEPINDSRARTETVEVDSAIRQKLENLATFLDEVVIELVMRDVHSLLETYLRSIVAALDYEFESGDSFVTLEPMLTGLPAFRGAMSTL